MTKCYETYDMFIAAYLLLHGHLPKTRVTNGYTFLQYPVEDVSDLVKQYYEDEAFQATVKAYKQIKSVVKKAVDLQGV